MNSDNIVARLDATFENTLRFDAEFQAVYVVEKSNILYNTTAGWNSQAELVAKEDYLYVYIDYKQTEDGQDIAGFKVGDNTSLLINLPFTDSIIYSSIEDIEDILSEVESVIEALDTNKLDKNNPTGTGSFSLNRKAETTIGNNSFTEGYGNTASGSCAHAEGQGTTASGSNGSHAEGRQTTASGLQSHAEGYATTAAGGYSHAEGSATQTGLTALASHAEGSSTVANGANSHAEGEGTTASGKDSHAGGRGTIAKNKSQQVFGEFNIQDPASGGSTVKGTYVEIVGNGTNTNARSNARTLDWNGNEALAGGLTASGNVDVKDNNGNTKVSLNSSTGDISCTSVNGVTPTEVTANPSDTATTDLTKLKVGNNIYNIPQGGSGSGGHTIVNDSGTVLTQRTNLQFKGVYSEDNSTDDTTEIDVVREMTKAEFDELTEAEKTGLINITDITGGNDDRFQPVIYSEEEREIGVWIDGKPLYEKTIYCGVLPNNGYKELSTPSDIDLLIDYFGFIKSIATPSGYSRPLPFAAGGSNDIRVDLTAGILRVVTFTDWSSAHDGYITIRYTKTTDTAGSGQWTPQGVPAHHFSENEQVVGTWINGKTLYEKTWYFQDNMVPIGRNWTSLNIDVSNLNINEVVDHRAQSYDSESVSIDVWNDSGTLKAQYWLDGMRIGSVTIRYTKTT